MYFESTEVRTYFFSAQNIEKIHRITWNIRRLTRITDDFNYDRRSRWHHHHHAPNRPATVSLIFGTFAYDDDSIHRFVCWTRLIPIHCDRNRLTTFAVHSECKTNFNNSNVLASDLSNVEINQRNSTHWNVLCEGSTGFRREHGMWCAFVRSEMPLSQTRESSEIE